MWVCMCTLGYSIFRKETKCSGVLSYVCLYLEYTPHSEEKTHFADTSTNFNMTAHMKLKYIQPLVYDQMHRYKIYSQQVKVFFFIFIKSLEIWKKLTWQLISLMHRIGFHTSMCWWLILIHSNEDSSLWSVWIKNQGDRVRNPQMIQKQQGGRWNLSFQLFPDSFDCYLLGVIIICEACCLSSLKKMFVLKWASHCKIKNKILPQQEIWDKDIHRPFQRRWEDVGNFFCWTPCC